VAAHIARRVVVTGQVQGVFFRDSARREARRRGLGGVRNRPDGAVEAVFEGEPDAVAALVLWCRDGPRHAQVEDLLVESVQPEGLTDFDVR
jgi:acylphosphatase